MSTMNCPKW